MDDNLFSHPPKEYRSLPFWSWNDKLEPEELRRQISLFDKQGIGGFFMHSREGLETEYLGQEWETAVKTAVSAAKERGMYSWIYDEDRWPSGAAGGRVTACGDQNRAKAIVIRKGAYFRPNTLSVFTVGADGYRRLTEGEAPAAVLDSCYTFSVDISGPSEWFNADAPANNLNPDCVADFLRITYGQYYRWVGDEFGKTIAGIFTDEPNFSDRRAVYEAGCGYIPYTDGLEKRFLSEYGYELADRLPDLFFEGPTAFQTRHDYWYLLSRIFTNSYTRQVSEWCDTHHAAFTGHFLYENDMGWATRMGGAIMPHYRYLHVPGIDMLCNQTDEFLTVMQCTSVARQMGRKYVISEMYGCTGWDFDFAGQRWIGDWQFALGVNLRCQHLALYSIRGCRKRDFPPCFNYNASWWHKDHLVEDYFARLTAVLSEGTTQNHILVLHPQSTAWGLLGSDIDRKEAWDQDSYQLRVNEYGYAFNRFLKELSFHQIGYDLGDEQIMAELGKAESGLLTIGEGQYNTVVIRQCQTILRPTYELLCDFVRQGGRVIFCDELLTRIDGHPGDLDTLRSAAVRLEGEALYACLSEERDYQITDRAGKYLPGILVNHKKQTDGDVFFLVNNDPDREKQLCFARRGEYTVKNYDCLTGEISDCPAEYHNGETRLELFLRPGQSVVLRTVPGRTHTVQVRQGRELLAALTVPDRVTALEKNVLVLDQCTGWLVSDGEQVSGEVWQVQRTLREKLGLRQVYYNGLVQRYRWLDEEAKSGHAVLVFKFDSELALDQAGLAMELADRYTISCNGIPTVQRPGNYYFDRDFRVVTLTGIRPGENELRLEVLLDNSLEMENIYLLGDFGVSPRRTLTKRADSISLGDYTGQGYYHYAGDMEYAFSFPLTPEEGKRYYLELDRIAGANVEVRVNGISCGDYPWAGREPVEITKALRSGMNQLSLIHTNTQRNLFGPFHDSRGKIAWTDWQVFRTEGDLYTPEYQVIPNGLYGPVRILVETEITK